jgi:hypothetical protein
MSTTRASGRPTGKPAAKKPRQTPATRTSARPEKNSTLLKSTGVKRKPPNAGNAMGITRKGIPNKVSASARECFVAFYENNLPEAQRLFDQVKRRYPVLALKMLLKGADHFLPKLQRTEFAGELNHHGIQERVRKPWPYPDGLGTNAVEAMQRYQMMISGKYEMPKTMERVQGAAMYRSMHGDDSPPQDIADFVRKAEAPPQWHQPEPVAIAAPRPRPKQDFLPADEAEPAERRPENVIVLEHTCALPEHRPVVDSRCGFCRQLWAKQQESAEDEQLRGGDYGRPRVVT